MKSIIFINSIILFSIGIINAQTMERFTLDQGGGMVSSDPFIVHYSIGQLFVKTIDLGNLIVSEGFVQGQVTEMSTAVDYHPEIVAKVYPNPSFDKIQITSNVPLPGSEVVILDFDGLPLLRKTYQQGRQFDIQHLPVGQYLLQWLDQEKMIVRQFKIVKL